MWLVQYCQPRDVSLLHHLQEISLVWYCQPRDVSLLHHLQEISLVRYCQPRVVSLLHHLQMSLVRCCQPQADSFDRGFQGCHLWSVCCSRWCLHGYQSSQHKPRMSRGSACLHETCYCQPQSLAWHSQVCCGQYRIYLADQILLYNPTSCIANKIWSF